MKRTVPDALRRLGRDHRKNQMGIVFASGVENVLALIIDGPPVGGTAGYLVGQKIIARNDQLQLLPLVENLAAGNKQNIDGHDLAIMELLGISEMLPHSVILGGPGIGLP